MLVAGLVALGLSAGADEDVALETWAKWLPLGVALVLLLVTIPAARIHGRAGVTVLGALAGFGFGLVGIAITLLGRAIVSYEVFIGRPLPRNRFFHQWRSTVLLAIGFGTVASALLVIELRPIYSLMMAVTLMALFYALYSWRSYAERERFMANLRPFLSSQNLYGRLTSAETLRHDEFVITKLYRSA